MPYSVRHPLKSQIPYAVRHPIRDGMDKAMRQGTATPVYIHVGCDVEHRSQVAAERCAGRVGGRRAGSAAHGRVGTGLTKAEQVQATRATIDRLTRQHVGPFPFPRRRIASPDPVDRAGLTAAALSHAMSGLRWYQWRRKREAREYAQQLASYWIAYREAEAHQRAAQAQAVYDEEWRYEQMGGAGVVGAQLLEAFRHADHRIIATVVDSERTMLVVTIPDEDVLPDRMPGTTEAGNPSLRKMTKQQRADLYRDTVASFGLAAAGRAFSAAPTLQQVLVTMQREASAGTMEPLVDAVIDRGAYSDDSSGWRRIGAWQALHTVSRQVRTMTVGPAEMLVPLAG